MEERVTKQEWEEWKTHKVTKEVWKVLSAKKEQAMQDWVDGVFQGHEVNLKAIGKVQMLDDILNMDYTDE